MPLGSMGVVLAISAPHPIAPAGDAAVLARLTQALGACANGLGGVEADAERLATIMRTLSLHGQCPLRPLEPKPERVRSGLPNWRLKRVKAYVEDNLSESVTLAGMAAAAGLSRMHFAAQFRVATGLRPHDYVLHRRIEAAQAMLIESGESLVQIALAVGFQTQAHFTTVFRRIVGDTPHQWRGANRACH
ncbi:MAG TPA: AraC family transcriptional regulator [Xanthobacteraceae bacterium]|nr:AraC family transcriptional regulator [Xanthobacteraceae bacterium]